MQRLGLLAVLLLLVLAPGATARAQGGTSDAAVQSAVAYVRSQQAPDGTFAGFGAGSTADAIFALAAANVNVAEVRNSGASAVEGLATLAPEAAKQPGVAAKFVIAALVAGQNPRALGGNDLVAAVQSGFNQATRQYGADVTAHALALIALTAAGEAIQAGAVAQLEKLQLPDGGWSFDGTAATGSDTNTTALAIQALTAASGTPDVRAKALAYLRTQQNTDGGFPFSQASQFGNASDANSTASSIQAIMAAGESLSDWAKEGKTPVDRLLAFQNPSGAFRFQDAQPEDNQLASYQAIPAVLSKSYPLEGIMIALPAQEEATPAAAAATAVATPEATTAGAPAPTPLPAPTPISELARLPDTGRSTLPALVLIGAMLMLAMGVALRRRSI